MGRYGLDKETSPLLIIKGGSLQVTGGVGREKLTSFYRHNFIFNNSADTELELISRTVGINTVVDEFIFKFTHDRGIDWL